MILHRYFARRFALSLLYTFLAFFILLALVDLIEQMRRFGAIASFSNVLVLTLLNLPQGLYEILPLILVLATIALFLSLARSSEMVVTRAAGRSALRSLLAPIAVTLAIGALAVGVLNPLVAATAKEYELRSNELRSGSASVLSIATTGLWLRQGSDFGQTVIRADRASLDGTALEGVSMIRFSADGTPNRRIEAEAARLVPGAWEMTNAKSWPLDRNRNAEGWATTHTSLRIASTLTPDEIQNGFGEPSSIPIWELPAFIKRLEQAGFSALRHSVWLQIELASPAFLVAMVLIGAGFTMRHYRSGRTGVMVLSAILLCFGLYFLRNFAQILGENGQIPIMLAAWAPPLAAIGAALGLLLHLEDG